MEAVPRNEFVTNFLTILENKLQQLSSADLAAMDHRLTDHVRLVQNRLNRVRWEMTLRRKGRKG